MKTNIIVAIGGFLVLVLAGTSLSMAQQETKEYCTLEFRIAGTEVDVEIFNVSFTKSGVYQKSGCEVKSTVILPDKRVMRTYLCIQPNTKVISEATRSYELVLNDEKNANTRWQRRPQQGLLDDRPLLASIDDPANVLAQAGTDGTPQVSFEAIAAACACGTSGPCSSGGIKCSTEHPRCPPC